MPTTLIARIKDRLSTSRLRGGFTMIEVMVAVLLLLLAMAGIVPLFLGGLSQASAVRYKSIATNIARERMEQIRQLDYREITSEASEGSTLVERFGDTVVYNRGSASITFDVAYTVEEAAYEEGTLKKVTVTVDWAAPPQTSAAAITTMIHQQFLGPRGSFLEVVPSYPDPLGTPFALIAGATKARYHIAQADWGLVFDDLDQPSMAAREVYMRLILFDDQGQSLSLGNPEDDFMIDNSHLLYTTGPDGRVTDVWFEHNFSAAAIPDGYWVLQAIVYNEYDQPGSVWRLRVRVENGPPAQPDPFIAVPQADNQSVVLNWQGGQERDRSHYVLERSHWHYHWGWGWHWSNWDQVSSDLDRNETTFTDEGSVFHQIHPWGSYWDHNHYAYRVRAVDISQPGLVGPGAIAYVKIPPDTTTTTLAPTTTTTAPPTTTTTAGLHTVYVKNTLSYDYSLTIKNGAGSTVFSGSVVRHSTRTIADLPAGNYQITATHSGRPTITQSFSLPAQSGQIVLTIL